MTEDSAVSEALCKREDREAGACNVSSRAAVPWKLRASLDKQVIPRLSERP